MAKIRSPGSIKPSTINPCGTGFSGGVGMGNKPLDYESGQRIAVPGQEPGNAPIQVDIADHGGQAGGVPAGGWLTVLRTENFDLGKSRTLEPLGNKMSIRLNRGSNSSG